MVDCLVFILVVPQKRAIFNACASKTPAQTPTHFLIDFYKIKKDQRPENTGQTGWYANRYILNF